MLVGTSVPPSATLGSAMPNTHHLLLFFWSPGWLSRRSRRPRRLWASSFATSFGASFGLGLSLGSGSNCIMGELIFVSICAFPESVVSTRASRSRGNRSCGGSRRRLLILLLVSFSFAAAALRSPRLAALVATAPGSAGDPFVSCCRTISLCRRSISRRADL